MRINCCLIILLCLIPYSYQYGTCPLTCSECYDSFISCEKIPKHVPSSVQSLQITNFPRTILTQNDFIDLKNTNIKKISLKTNKILTIESEAFKHLKNVKFINLSHNVELEIKNNAFMNLNLDTLLLKNINVLKLHPNSFNNIRVRYLNLDRCYLAKFDYLVFSKLSKESLRKLSMEGNGIRFIDKRFYSLFSNLLELNLNELPMNCNCSSLWLKKLTYKRNISITFPKCLSPRIARDRYLSDVDERLLKCVRPVISEIFLNFLSPNSMQLRCNIKRNKWKLKQDGVLVSIKNDSGYLVHQNLNKASILLSRSEYENISNLSCIAETEIEKTNINIKIKWSTFQKTSTPVNQVTVKTEKYQPITTAKSFYFNKRFTLIELIIATILTFTVTVIIFFLIYKVFIFKSCGSIHNPLKTNAKLIASNNLTITDTNYNDNQYIKYRTGINNNDSKNILPPLPNNNNPISPTPLSSYMTNTTHNNTSSTNIHQHYPLMNQQSNVDLASLNIIQDSNSQTYDCISVNNNNNSTLNSSNNALFSQNPNTNATATNNIILPAPIPPPPSNYLTNNNNNNNNNNNINCTLPRSKFNYTNNTYDSQPHFFDYKTQQRLYNGQI